MIIKFSSKLPCFHGLGIYRYVRRIYAYLEIFYEKDMLACRLRASPSLHSWETIYGETIAEFYTSLYKLAQKSARTFAHFALLITDILLCFGGKIPKIFRPWRCNSFLFQNFKSWASHCRL